MNNPLYILFSWIGIGNTLQITSDIVSSERIMVAVVESTEVVITRLWIITLLNGVQNVCIIIVVNTALYCVYERQWEDTNEY